MSSIQMMPIVFCASLPPWPRLYIEEEKSCSLRNRRSTRLGVVRRKIQEMAISSNAPTIRPMKGERKMNATVLRIPAGISAQVPAFATPAPTRPPLSPCQEEDRTPQYHVTTFQA